MIRPARPEEAEAVAALARALHASQGNPPGYAAPDAARDLLSDRPAALLRVAERDGALVGYATALPAYESGHRQRGAYVADLYVDAAHRGRGIGRALLGALAAATRAKGGTFLWWVARDDNAAAHAFYRRVTDVEDPVRAFAATGAAFDRLADTA